MAKTHNYMASGKCYGCRKSVGTDYLSHPRTDCKGDDGVNWGDAALCLCEECAAATEQMYNVSQFVAWRAATHPPEPPGPKYPPGSLVYRPEGDCDGELIGTDHFVVTVCDDWQEVACAPDEELGRLFAAAPDLLAALKATLALWREHGLGDSDEQSEPVWTAALAAVKKAEGK